MKQKHLIVMNILTPGSCIHVNRAEWTLEHVTAPKPSCVDKWRLRNSLRELQPGATRFINGIQVHKHLRNYSTPRYVIGGRIVKFEDAIAILEGRRAA